MLRPFKGISTISSAVITSPLVPLSVLMRGAPVVDHFDGLRDRAHLQFEIHARDLVHFEDDVGLAHGAKAGVSDGDLRKDRARGPGR